jgi:hypothetical protein
MGKKHPLPRPWTVKLTSSYHRDRDERRARAYELVLPIVSQPTQPSQQKELPHDTLSTERPLRTRVQ